MWAQIVGKTRLALAPMENHWWQVALYVSSRGLATSPMPAGDRDVEVHFDFIAHQLLIQSSDGRERRLPLGPMSVADFYARYMQALHELGIAPKIHPVPVEIETAIPFAEDRTHAAYLPQAAQSCWRILLETRRVMQQYRAVFLGKQSPVHFFWGSFDLAATRFSGRRAPPHPGGVPHCPDWVMVEAYSHECSSCGFWPGDENAPPFFYSYAYPEPAGYAAAPVTSPALYDGKLKEFVLPYDAVREAAHPGQVLLRFFQETYQAAADCGGWDRPVLERAAPPRGLA
jgi:hypothetical protein